MVALDPEKDIKLSLKMKKAICTSIYHRLRSVKSYSRSTLPPINSSITLIKPTQPTLRCMPEDYGLRNVITQKFIQIYLFPIGNSNLQCETWWSTSELINMATVVLRAALCILY